MKYVTSFSAGGYEQYGRRFLETYVTHMRHPIVVYVESPCGFSHPLVTYRNLFTVPGCKEFLSRMLFDVMHGKMWDGTYDYRYAVNRFCRKHFAAFDAAEHETAEGGDWLVWLDADVELGAPIPDPADGPFMYYLGRPEWHSCSSYVAWDLRKPCSANWWINIRNVYLTGTVFALSEWHDSFINDWIRQVMNFDAVNLAAPYADQLKGPANVFDFVFPGNHHKKGALKFQPSPGKVVDAAPVNSVSMPHAARKNRTICSAEAPVGMSSGRYAQIRSLIEKVKPKTIAEIGTWNGYRAIEMAKEALRYQNEVTYYGYDLFEGASDVTDEEEKNVKPHYTKELVSRFLEEFKKSHPGFDYVLTAGNTRETLKPLVVDFAFIDGGHSVETIQKDYEALKDSRFILFDDYYEGGIDINQYGCNRVIENLKHTILPVGDAVAGGGVTRFVMVENA